MKKGNLVLGVIVVLFIFVVVYFYGGRQESEVIDTPNVAVESVPFYPNDTGKD